MIKKFLTVCAGVMMSSGFALAVNVNGVYSGGANGQNLSVTLQSQDGVVRGSVALNGSSLPLVGHEANGSIQGVWRTAKGQEIPFAAVAGPDGLQIQTNGMTYSLARGEESQETPVAPIARQVQQEPDQAEPAVAVEQVQLQTRQGRVMACDIPAGWAFSDSTNGVDVNSPDNITYMAHTFLRSGGRTTCDLFLKKSMAGWGRFGTANMQITSVKEINAGSKVYELQYTSHGRPARGAVQVTVRPGPEGFIAEMVIIQSSPEKYEQYKPMLIAMAKSVRVLDGNAFCQNGVMDGEIRKQINIRRQSQIEVNAIRQAGIEHQNHVRDEINQGADDVIRDQTRFDDAGGNQYVGPLQAERMFKHADGTVTYSTNTYDPVPADAVELTPHRLSRR